MKKIFIIFCFLQFLISCSSVIDPNREFLKLQEIPEGHAVVLLEITYQQKSCGRGRFSLLNKASMQRYHAKFSYHTFVPAGSYQLTYVRCGQRYVSTGPSKSMWEKSPKTKELMRSLIASPQFTVKAGEIRHIGSINIKTIKKAHWLKHGEQVILEPLPANEAHKLRLQKGYPSLYSRIKFQPADSLASKIFSDPKFIEKLQK